jgi:hypothetical protein
MTAALTLGQVPAVRRDELADRLRPPRAAGVRLDRRRVAQNGRGDLPQPLDPSDRVNNDWSPIMASRISRS